VADIQVLFGGGRNTKSRTADIQPQECADGENFDLSLADSGFTRRKPFDKIATATNAGSIKGYAQLIKQDGTTSTLIQAGGNVYEWDGATTFTLQGACNASSQLRGSPYTHNYTLSEFVIITDLQKLTVVKKWDGTTYGNLAHNLGGDYFAKYVLVNNERALYANVKSGTDTPHVLVGSKLGDAENLSVANRPSTSIAVTDPWFLPTPDLKPMNGLTEGFGVVTMSTVEGRLWKLSGTNSQDFSIAGLYLGSSASGDEGITNIGNDVVYGRAGVIESLSGVNAFGDTETDDISRWIQPDIETVTSWTIVYDRKFQRVLCFPSGVGEVHVLHKGVLATEFSPWSKWTTTHSLDFTPTCVWQMKDPVSGEDRVFMGDSAGNIYGLDGTGGMDAGTDNITAYRESGLVKSALSQVQNITGFVDYQKKATADTLTVTFKHGGSNIFDQAIDISLVAQSTVAVYGGAYYYNNVDTTNASYYGLQFERRLARQTYSAAGQSSEFQVKTSITGSTDFRVDELRVNFAES